MPIARKKPVEIEFKEFTGSVSSIVDIVDWARKGGCTDVITSDITQTSTTLIIHTLEGNMTAKATDLIIKGVNGEFYPCDAEVFKKTYDIKGVGYD